MGRSTRGAGTIHVSEDIIAIAEFKAHLSETVRGLGKRGRPVVVTQNGKPAAVLLSPAAFDQLAQHANFMSAVSEGLADVDAGRTIANEEVGMLLDERFGKLTKAKKPR